MTSPWFADDSVTLFHGDAQAVLAGLDAGSVGCVVTSPPYFGLRDYGVDGQIGVEASPAEYVARLVAVFAEVRRVLADDGTLWLNLGDSYVSKPAGVKGVSMSTGLHGGRLSERYRENLEKGHGTKRDTTGMGLPEKNLMGMPWRAAFALQDDGWILRNEIIWHKLTAMPESVRDRLSNRHEHLFLFSKSRRYHFDLDAIREEAVTSRPGALTWDRSEQGVPGQKPQHRPGRAGGTNLRPNGSRHTSSHEKGKNPGDVWSMTAEPFPGAHFATFPSELPRRCIAAGAKPGSVVLDPFHGSGTTGMVATRAGHRYVGIDLSEEYLRLSLRTRLADGVLVPAESGEAGR